MVQIVNKLLTRLLSRSSESNRLLLGLFFHLDPIDFSLFKLFLLFGFLHDSKLGVSLPDQLFIRRQLAAAYQSSIIQLLLFMPLFLFILIRSSSCFLLWLVGWIIPTSLIIELGLDDRIFTSGNT